MSVSSPKQIKALEKKVRRLRKKQKKQRQAIDYDDLNSLSSDDSFSSADSEDSSVQDLGNSSQEEEEQSSAGVSASLDSEEDEEDHANKKRKFDTPPKLVASKRPTAYFPRSITATDQERTAKLYTATACNIQELERMNVVVLENLKTVDEATARLQEKENARVEDSLFVLDHDKRKKDLDQRELALKRREADTEAKNVVQSKESENTRILISYDDKRKKELDQRELAVIQRETESQLAVDAARQLERQLVARVTELEKQEQVRINQRETELQAARQQEKYLQEREEELQRAVDAAHQLEGQLVTRAAELEKQEKNATVSKVKPAIAVSPLDGFLAEMHKSNQNMLSLEDMCAIVPSNLMCNLAYLGGRQRLKYHSVSNSQFLIAEVTNVESGKLEMRQIVSKQLYNAK